MSPGQLHRSATGVLSLCMLVIGIALIGQGLTTSGGDVVRVVLGLLFAAAGGLRLYVLRRGARS